MSAAETKISFVYFARPCVRLCILCKKEDIGAYGVVPCAGDDPICVGCLKQKSPESYGTYSRFCENVRKADSWDKVRQLRDKLCNVDTGTLDKRAAGETE
jgi:hypothetical protein